LECLDYCSTEVPLGTLIRTRVDKPSEEGPPAVGTGGAMLEPFYEADPAKLVLAVHRYGSMVACIKLLHADRALLLGIDLIDVFEGFDVLGFCLAYTRHLGSFGKRVLCKSANLGLVRDKPERIKKYYIVERGRSCGVSAMLHHSVAFT
jgi:hypothetical protein